MNGARVVAVSASPVHSMAKQPQQSIRLLAGLGVEGDTHSSVTVQHRSRVARDASAPNLRQVHLLHHEIIDELAAAGFVLAAGQIGENIMTAGLDLLGLATGSVLTIGSSAAVEITGLRNPCRQLDGIQPGLMAAFLSRDDAGRLVRRAGVMGIVISAGEVRAGDAIVVRPPAGPHRPLEPV